jgi:hypothetical protein
MNTKREYWWNDINGGRGGGVDLSRLLGGRRISIQCCQRHILHYITLRPSLGSGIVATNCLSSGTVN